MMADKGHEVLYVDAHKHKRTEMVDIIDGISHVTMRWSQYRQFMEGRDEYNKAIIKYLVTLKPDIVMVNAPYWADIAIGLKVRSGARLLYDVIDHYPGFADLEKKGPEVVAAHLKLIGHSDACTYTAMTLKPEHGHAIYVPNACDFHHWDKERTPGGPAGYFGTVAYWFDHEAVPHTAQLIGPGTESGPMSYDKIPQIASQWGCGLIPFKDMVLTQSTNPVKLYEYMALGLPIVASDLPEIRHISETIPEHIRPYLVKSGQSWTDYIRGAIDHDDETLIEERKDWARKQTWHHRYKQMEILFS